MLVLSPGCAGARAVLSPAFSFSEPITMDLADVVRLLNLSGLFLGFVGTVIVWRNSAPAGGQASLWMDEAMAQAIARRGAAARLGLRFGLGLLAAGFFLQFAAAAM